MNGSRLVCLALALLLSGCALSHPPTFQDQVRVIAAQHLATFGMGMVP